MIKKRNRRGEGNRPGHETLTPAVWRITLTASVFGARAVMNMLLEIMLAYFGRMGLLTTAQRFVQGMRGFGPDGRVK